MQFPVPEKPGKSRLYCTSNKKLTGLPNFLFIHWFYSNSNCCKANERKRRIQISSQWWLIIKCNPCFIPLSLCCIGQLHIQPSCTISCTFGWVNRGLHRLEIAITFSGASTMLTGPLIVSAHSQTWSTNLTICSPQC